MSYCVNCGVELQKAANRCPLCDTVVINPKETKEVNEKLYPQNWDTFEFEYDKSFWVKMLSLILSIPAVVCAVANYSYNNEFSWSLYVAGAMCLMWIAGVFPLLFKRPRILLFMALDMAAVLGYLYLIEHLSQIKGWFLGLAFPSVVLLAVFTLVLTVFIQKKLLKVLYIIAAIFFSIGLTAVGAEIITDAYFYGTIHIIWSSFVLISCIAIGIMFIIMENHKRAKEKLIRKFHI